MAFTSSVDSYGILGDRRCTRGRFEQGGSDTGGDIDTHMTMVELLLFQIENATATADVPVVNETFPCDGRAVTIVTPAGVSGVWCAIGCY